MKNSLDLYLKLIVPALQITQEEMVMIKEDPNELINASLAICDPETDDDSIKASAARLLRSIALQIDGMHTFIVDFALNIIDKTVHKSVHGNQAYVEQIVSKFGLKFESEEAILEVFLMVISVLGDTFGKRADLQGMVDGHFIRLIPVLLGMESDQPSEHKDQLLAQLYSKSAPILESITTSTPKPVSSTPLI